MQPETRYAKSGDVHIAYQVVGDGPIDLVFVMGWVSHLEYFWNEPHFAQLADRALQDGIADEHVRPDRVEEVLLGNQSIWAGGKKLQQRKRLWRQRHGRLAAIDASTRGIEAEFAEREHWCGLQQRSRPPMIMLVGAP